MKRKLPLLLIAFVLIFSSFSDETKSKIAWFKSTTGDGYISMERIDSDNAQSVLKTTVNSYFGDEKLNFSTLTVTDSEKLANASKIVFNGTIDSNMEPVEYLGERLKTKKSGTFWSFHGNYKNEITRDPEVNQFLLPNHSAVIKMPTATIPSFNVWAIVSNLPFNKTEGTFRFNSLDETKLYVRKNQVIEYMGEEVASVDGENQTVHKFVHFGKKVKPAYYWVNNDRQLVKFILDEEFEFVVSTKEEAMGRPIANITED